MKFDVNIKSGTCGYSDYDNCDMCLQENIETEQLPNKGDYIILENEGNYPTYLVTEVHRNFLNKKEFNTVYVIQV